MTDHIAASAVANTDPMPDTEPARASRIATVATALLVLDVALLALGMAVVA